MRLFCPCCNTRAEIISYDDDVVFYCKKCGMFRDLTFAPSPSDCVIDRVIDKPHKRYTKKSGRYLISPEGLAKIKEMREGGMSIEDISFEIGVTRQTMYRYRKMNEELSKILDVKE